MDASCGQTHRPKTTLTRMVMLIVMVTTMAMVKVMVVAMVMVMVMVVVMVLGMINLHHFQRSL